MSQKIYAMIVTINELENIIQKTIDDLILPPIHLNEYIKINFIKTTQSKLPGWINGEFEGVSFSQNYYEIPIIYDDKPVYIFRNKCDKNFYVIRFCYNWFGGDDILINSEPLEFKDIIKIASLKDIRD